MTPVVYCVDGRYRPFRPSEFICQPAIALLISTGGEVEVFSPDGVCNQKVTYSEHFAATGHSVNLVDDQLILVGQEPEGRSWKYITLHDPRGGLLASKMSISGTMLGGSAPTHHSSFSRGASLYLLRGSQGTQAKYEKGVWNNLNLRWQDGRAFSSFVIGSCSVTLNKDTIMIFGGFTAGTKEVLKSVIAINIIQQTVEERAILETIHNAYDLNEKGH